MWLELFQRNQAEFLRRFVTVDVTWVHHYTRETKQQSKQRTLRGKRTPKKAKTAPSARKIMATLFWDSRVIFIDYLDKGRSITGQYYSDLLGRIEVELKKKRLHLAKKKVLFHYDNAPAHSSTIAIAKLFELRHQLLTHPP
ncbi:PREDICTED: histone-lysine N-methyltransferase SETMAR-like, partial [Dinoponera quadriceps]|uniref:Histone-lysine N-methyltransferase SETMAR-like n=1 Tax=Dinoponera quadriceps TaxID=609295 RepID=A0A6P3Y8V1_DINQU